MIDTTMNSGSAANTAGSEKPKPVVKTSGIRRLADLPQATESEENKIPEPKSQLAKLAASKPTTKPKCNHGPNQRCPNCLDEDAGMIADRKHDPFDGFV